MGLQTEFLDNVHEAPPPAQPRHPLHAASLGLFKASAPAAAAASMQQLIDDLPEQIALLDEDCTIVAANRAWQDACTEHGYWNNQPGYNYRDFCAAKAAEGYDPAVQALAAMNEIILGERNSWQLIYNGKERWSDRDYRICFHRIAVGSQSLISVTRYDLTEISELRRFKDDVTSHQTDPAEALRNVVEGFSEQVAVADEHWTIVAVNEAWKEMVRVTQYPELAPGLNYRDFVSTFAGKGHASALAVLDGIDSIDDGKSESFELTYAGADHWEGRTLLLRINRLRLDGHSFATISRHDVTDHVELLRLKDDFTHSLIEGQSLERQRMARELHDSTSQLLTGIGLLLGRLKQDPATSDSSGLVEEMQQLVSETHREIRSISYVAHTPPFDPMDLSGALRALVEGFGRRTELNTVFDVESGPFPLAEIAVHALYRVAQEVLSNVHRHARAKSVKVRLCSRRSYVHLFISDDGIGLSDDTLAGRGTAGVGLTGMRSRLAEIGGRLTVHRLSPGTAVIASVSTRT